MSKYKAIKLAQRSDPSTTDMYILPGHSVEGEVYVANDSTFEWEKQDKLEPRIDFCIKILGNRMDKYLRTSYVTCYMIYGDIEGPDRFIKPSWCPIEAFEKIAPKDGDVLVQTANSIYFFEKLGE